MIALQSMTFLGVPLYTLSKCRGMSAAVNSLRNIGLTDTLKESVDSFTDLGDVQLNQITADSGPGNMRNFSHFLNDTNAIMDRVERVPSEDFAFCLGGECGLALGTLAGLKLNFRGTPGLLWLDAHGDFNTPETTQSGFVGGMPLAFVCGRGPKFSPRMENLRPLVKEENVVHLGSRDLDPLEAEALESSAIRLHSTSSLRTEGLVRTAYQEASYLADNTDWIVCHLDVDVIDPTVVPAVSFPTKEGLTVQDVRTIIGALLKTDKLKVFNLTAYEPSRDNAFSAGRTIVALMSEIFTSIKRV